MDSSSYASTLLLSTITMKFYALFLYLKASLFLPLLSTARRSLILICKDTFFHVCIPANKKYSKMQ